MRNSNTAYTQRVSVPGDLPSRLSAELNAVSTEYGPAALRISIGIVFLWFGVLKFFPSVSPAEDIAVQTLRMLSFDLVPDRALILGLASFETALGSLFVAGVFPRVALPLLVGHMLGTALPFVFFPGQLFNHSVLVPTFLGQYILKNIIIISAAVVLKRRWR